MNQKRFGMGIPSLNLMALNAKNDSHTKETVRMKKEEFSDDDFDDDFILEDDEKEEKAEEKKEEKEEPVQIDFNPVKKRNLQGQAPDPKSYLKPSQIKQQQQKRETKEKPARAAKNDLVSARKPMREESKIPEKRTQIKKSNVTQQQQKTAETRAPAAKQTNIYASPSMLSDNRSKQANGPTPAAVAIRQNAAAMLKERLAKANAESNTPSKPASQVKISPVKDGNVRKQTQLTNLKQDQEAKKVTKANQVPSCYYRPPSSRRHLDEATPATSRVPTKATQAAQRKPAAQQQTRQQNGRNVQINDRPTTTAAGARKVEVQGRIPATARNKKPSSLAKEINPIMTEKERQEILKEYGEDFFDDIKDMGWLDDLSDKEKKLEMNFKAAEALDPSILNLYEAGASQIKQKPDEDEFDVAMRMLDAGFDVIHKQSMAEKALLEERNKLLDQIHAELLIDHTAGYKSHLE